jgi:hypothetical protein
MDTKFQELVCELCSQPVKGQPNRDYASLRNAETEQISIRHFAQQCPREVKTINEQFEVNPRGRE